MALEQHLRLAHEVLVEGVLAGDQDGQTVAAPPCASPLLAEGSDRPWEADGDCTVEQADVDAELEGIGGGDAEQLPLDEPALDLPPLCRCVTRAIRSEAGAGLGVDPVDGELVDQLRGLPALREADRAQAARHEPRHETRRLAERARAQPELGIEQLGIPQCDRSLGARSCVAIDDRGFGPAERRRELTGVCDRRGCEEQLRARAVDTGEPPEPSQHVGDV